MHYHVEFIFLVLGILELDTRIINFFFFHPNISAALIS